jgi:hypothetical protein
VQKPKEAAISILKRELGVEVTSITQLIALNPEGWAINSSFSNQKLYGFVAHIAAGSPSFTTAIYPADSAGVHQLLCELTCLQCRSVLLEWYVRQSGLSQ